MIACDDAPCWAPLHSADSVRSARALRNWWNKAAADKAAADKAAVEKAATSQNAATEPQESLLAMLGRLGIRFDAPAPESAANKAAENKARRALEEDGFALEALLPETDARLLRSLEALLQTERPEWLGKGKDVSQKYGPYDSLKLACAWKVDHPRNLDKYTAGVKRVQQELELLEKKGKDVSYVPGLPVKTDRVRGFALSEACNEVILLHGTNPDRLLDLLSTGLNERFAGIGAGARCGRRLRQRRLPRRGPWQDGSVRRRRQRVRPEQ